MIEPVSRVEGHGKVTILLDDQNKVHQVRLHIVEFRGFERFIQGRPYWEVPVMVQRLCGICPVSHHLAASKALDAIVGAKPMPTAAERIRRLMHYGQILQSHALHFYPPVVAGPAVRLRQRAAGGATSSACCEQYPDLARQGILLRKFGQEVIRMTAGKRVHGTGSIPGGMNKPFTAAERDELLQPLPDVLAWAQTGVALIAELHRQHRDLYDRFGTVRSSLLSLVGARRQARSLRRRAARARRRREDHLRRRRVPGLRPGAARERALLELHEVPVHRFTRARRTAGTRSGRSRASRTATPSGRRWPRRRGKSSWPASPGASSTRRCCFTGRA